MAGILNKKERVLDVVITEFGRDAMSKGTFNPVFYSFSDKGVDYRTDNGTSIASDASIVSFEGATVANDILVPEVEDQGAFSITRQLAPEIYMVDGEIVEVSGDGNYSVTLEAYDIADYDFATTENIFRSMQILRDRSSVPDFTVSPPNLSVSLLKTDNYSDKEGDIAPLTEDSRLGNTLNIRKMPPVVFQNGSYEKMIEDEFLKDLSSEEDVLKEIQDFSQASTNLTLGDGYSKYDLIGQVFIKSNEKIKKLSIIEVDEFIDSNGIPSSKVYHCGDIIKEYIPDSGVSITRFARTLSIVFHNGSLDA